MIFIISNKSLLVNWKKCHIITMHLVFFYKEFKNHHPWIEDMVHASIKTLTDM